MAGPRIDLFSGIRPRASDFRLLPGEASSALDVDLRKGLLRPRPKQRAWQTGADQKILLADGAEPETLFLFRDKTTDAHTWMYWLDDVDVVSGPSENAEQRHYYTGDGVPKLFTASSIFDTSPPYPEMADTKYPFTWYALGVPAPSTAPTVDSGSYVPPGEGSVGLITAVISSTLTIAVNLDRLTTSAYTNDPAGPDGLVAGIMSNYMVSPTGPQVIVCLNAGVRFRVTEIVDGDNVKVVRSGGVGPCEDLGMIPENTWYWSDNGTSPASDGKHNALSRPFKDAKRKSYYMLPDEVTLTVDNHILQVDDIIRVTGSATAMQWQSTTQFTVPAYTGSPRYGFTPATPDSGNVAFAGETSFVIERNGSEIDPVVPAETDIQIVSRAYLYTFVSFLGEESAPSPPSSIVTLRSGDSIALTALEAPPTERRSIDRIWVYRSNTGSTNTDFQFVGEITVDPDSVDVLGFTDDVLDENLGEVLQSEGWDTPPTDMIGLVALPNGGLAGFRGNTLCLSEPGFPHAWPADYRQSIDFDIVGLEVYGNSIYLTTKGKPYIAVGVHPLQTSLRRVDIRHQCVDKRSLVNTGQKIVYVGREGLISAGDNGFANETDKYYTKEQWLELIDDAGVRGWYYDDQYIMQCEDDAGAPLSRLIFDFRDENLRITSFDEAIIAAYADPETAELFYVTADEPPITGTIGAGYRPLLRWDYAHPLGTEDFDSLDLVDSIGGNGLVGEWASGLMRFPEPMSLSCARVICRRVPAPSGGDSDCLATISIQGYRFDEWSADTGLGGDQLQLLFDTNQILISGEPGIGGWSGEQRSKPFRLDANLLVDAIRISLIVGGAVEVEAVQLGETLRDLSST